MLMMNLVSFALTGADAVIDTALVAEVIATCKTVMGLFTEFPLNVILVTSIAAICFGLFKSARSAV